MRVLIVGAGGMLGRDLCTAAERAGTEVRGVDLPECDITDAASIESHVHGVDWVVNCAAYTDVDRAETEREASVAVNVRGVRELAGVCARRDVRLLQISTDYVFDGKMGRPYVEDDRPAPLGAYGRDKLEGERASLASGAEVLIVRTQALFGVHGRNFVRSIMKRLADSDEPLRIVQDQVECPTYTHHLADAILRLLATGKTGIVHASAAGECSWHTFGCEIVERVKPGHPVVPVTSQEYVLPAVRPAYSVLDKTRYETWTGARFPHWSEGLAAYLQEVRRAERGGDGQAAKD